MKETPRGTSFKEFDRRRKAEIRSKQDGRKEE
jgi:hypothetical protein